ncbi:class I SAM-dependent methyltransferase [Paenibacillus glufosinatiresistens]|uniref:class I SAM-dependent methyltransferase n=1 Tax=Paenibacillus glufosinatiresistens TaxID=3070657 RepID=UPI00286DC1D7|nr:class I SAM-dependent methyltransferase [Paenibacillus sp. YX.27]
MIITTGDRPQPEVVRRAEQLAAEVGAPYVPRGHFSIAKLSASRDGAEVLVVLQEAVRLLRPGRPPLEFHPSMGFVRAKRILRGEGDPMLEAADMRPGDSVLDCTAGLGTDSLLFAVYGGPESAVTALESSLALHALLKEGMTSYRSGLAPVDDALRRIRVVRSEHLEYMRSLPEKSLDIVYFDPMFREPLEDSSAISPLRAYANDAALSEESVREAVRVARKRVILKEKKGSSEFRRLGFDEEARNHAKTSYGVIRIDD